MSTGSATGYIAVATVEVINGNGVKQTGCQVSGRFVQLKSRVAVNADGLTGRLGTVTLRTPTLVPWSQPRMQFCITGIMKLGLTYTPRANAATCVAM